MITNYSSKLKNPTIQFKYISPSQKKNWRSTSCKQFLSNLTKQQSLIKLDKQPKPKSITPTIRTYLNHFLFLLFQNTSETYLKDLPDLNLGKDVKSLFSAMTIDVLDNYTSYNRRDQYAGTFILLDVSGKGFGTGIPIL